jgi:hypothetical protein
VSEPINTTAPWARPQKPPLTQVEAERKAFEAAARKAMTEPGNGKVHPMSVTSEGYEPNRPMVVRDDANEITKKIGKHQPGYNDIVVDKWDKVVVYSVVTCVMLIVAVSLYLFFNLG